jgi:iron complex outermembrane receptor protein
VTPSIYYQNRELHNVSAYWPVYSNPGNNQYINGDPTGRPVPDKFYLPALKIDGDLGPVHLISNTSFYHRQEQTGYDGTEYNLGFYQTFSLQAPVGFVQFQPGVPFPLIDGNGIHLPADIADYRSPASIDNGQENLTQELRLVSSDPNAKLIWTTGVFFSENRQHYLEQIHDPMLNAFWLAVAGVPYTDVFTDLDGNPVPYVGSYPTDSYFLQTHSTDRQIAWYGEGTYSLTDTLKLTAGARFSRTQFSFNTFTGGPQLFNAPLSNSGDKKENSFTPKLDLSYQPNPNDLYYATYAKGFRPGGANNPVPQAACAQDFQSFGITASPATYDSDTVNSLRDRRQEQHREPCPLGHQRVLRALEQHPADRRTADLPDFLHLQSRHRRRQGRRHPGGYPGDQCALGRDLGRLHRCPLHPGLQIIADAGDAHRLLGRRHQRTKRPAESAGYGVPRPRVPFRSVRP